MTGRKIDVSLSKRRRMELIKPTLSIVWRTVEPRAIYLLKTGSLKEKGLDALENKKII